MFGEGDSAPDFSLSTAEGDFVSLTDVLGRDHHALVVFLRHLG